MSWYDCENWAGYQPSNGISGDAGQYIEMRRLQRVMKEKLPAKGRTTLPEVSTNATAAATTTTASGARSSTDYMNWKKMQNISCIGSASSSGLIDCACTITDPDVLIRLQTCIDAASDLRTELATESYLMNKLDVLSGTQSALMTSPPLKSILPYVKKDTYCFSNVYTSRNSDCSAVVHAALKRVRGR